MIRLPRSGKAWRLFTLALVALPWFMRDHLATALDRDTQTAQQVMDALRSDRLRQAREREQRDTSQRLQRIEIDVLRLVKSASDQEADEAMARAHVQELHEEAEALSAAAGELASLTPSVLLEDGTRRDLETAATEAQAASEHLIAGVQVGTEAQAVAPLLAAFDQASDRLEKAYERLHQAADTQRATRAQWAEGSRLLAWLMTGLGALLIGGWRTALGAETGGTLP